MAWILCQELAKYGLPRGCAEHNLLLMMQVQALIVKEMLTGLHRV